MRTFWKSLLGIVILCILAAVVIFFLFWSRVPDMVASRLSKTLKVAVEIGDINLSMNRIEVEHFEISNPRNYQLDRAFGAQQILVNAPLTRYLHNDIVIDEIDVNDVYIGLEFDSPKGTTGNWTTIMNNAQASQEESSKTSKKTVLIKKLVLTNISAELLYRSEGKVRRLKTIPKITLYNINSQGGNLSDQLMNSALGQAIKEIFVQENLKDVIDRIFKIPSNPNPVDVFKGLFGETN